jgi:hypothetical protein
MNCESSDAILQTYVNPLALPKSSGENLSDASEDDSDDDNDDENDVDYVDESTLYAYKGSMYEEDNNDILSNDFIKKEIDVSPFTEIEKSQLNIDILLF